MSGVKEMETATLVAAIKRLEKAYRAGKPEVSDAEFDHVYLAELEKRDRNHPLLNRIGEEGKFGDGKVVHPKPMLSTDKAYTTDEVAEFTDRVESVAVNYGMKADNIFYRITPKLDGMAARYDGKILATRGNGLVGNDITSAIGRGMVMDEPGVGEIVMPNIYFETYLSTTFSHPRNVVVGAVKADEPSSEAQSAFEAGAIRFVNYNSLHNIRCSGSLLIEKLDEFNQKLVQETEYPIDGIVIEVLDETIKEIMGATSHHHRWMLAKKTKGEFAITTVEDIEWSIGRTGRVTPIVSINSVYLAGANISNVTAHHAGNVKALGIGRGAVLQILRSGEVIPFIDKVVKAAESVDIPTECPSCKNKLRWEGDFIVCDAEDCDEKCNRRIKHFFETIGNIDLFGEKSVRKLVKHGHRDLLSIYQLTSNDFEACGFGEKQSKNLVAELLRSRTDAVEDWRWLGALGIPHLGRGNSRRLLKVHSIDSLCELSEEDLDEIESFGPITAPRVFRDLRALWPTIEGLMQLSFNMVSSQVATAGKLEGKRVVFSGTMEKSRKEIEAQAISFGAKVQKSVSGNTDWLVAGKKPGASKISKAKVHGVEIINFEEYGNRISA